MTDLPSADEIAGKLLDISAMLNGGVLVAQESPQATLEQAALILSMKAEIEDERLNYEGAMDDLASVALAFARRASREANWESGVQYLVANYPKQAAQVFGPLAAALHQRITREE
jgi:hypothetical protein